MLKSVLLSDDPLVMITVTFMKPKHTPEIITSFTNHHFITALLFPLFPLQLSIKVYQLSCDIDACAFFLVMNMMQIVGTFTLDHTVNVLM